MIFARVAIATCACLVLAACASTNSDDLAAVAENPSTTAVEVESVDTSETPAPTDDLEEGELDAVATTSVATTTEAPPEQVAEDPSDDEAPTDEATETEPAQEAAPDSSTTDAQSAPNPDSPLNGTFATVGGQSIDLATLQGQDVVLWFWAPW